MIDHYTYHVSWSPEDGEHVATVLEFPSLSWLAADQIAALSGLREIVRSVVVDMEASGEPVPAPLADRTYSGKLLLRTTPDLHRRLAIEAAEAGVSLNRLINSRLSPPP